MTKVRFCFQIAALSLLLSAWIFPAWAADETTSGAPAVVEEAYSPAPIGMQEVKPDYPGAATEIQHPSPARQPVAQFDEPKRSLRPHSKASLEPVWSRLEELTPAERQNAVIELELPTGASQEALAHARKVEDAWNSGNFEEALQLFRELGELMDIHQVAVGISWKTPIETSHSGDWFTDVRIGNRENIYNQELDFDGPSGHLFAALLYEEGGQWRWSVNISSDGGATWSETYEWWASYQINDISATAVGIYFWVSYSGGVDQFGARLRRCFASDGSIDAGYGWVEVFDKGSAIEDLDLSANAEAFNNRIYLSSILANGTLALFYDDAGGMSFTEVTTGITNADRGLDSHWNNNFSTFHTWFSWINTADDVHVARWTGTNFDDVHNTPAGGSAGNSSVGCWGDTVICVYEYDGPSNYYIRYRITYDGGAGWAQGSVGNTSLSSWGPHVTGRMGGGFHVVYEIEIGEPDDVMYTWRTYATPGWATPVAWNDYDVTTGAVDKPRIEWVPGGAYGGIYTNSGPEYCYFDRTDWVGVSEGAHVLTPKGFNLSQTRPNPFHANTVMSFSLPATSHADLSIHDVSGRRVATLTSGSLKAGTYSFTWDGKNSSGREVPSGVYFYRLTTRDFTSTRKAVLLR